MQKIIIIVIIIIIFFFFFWINQTIQFSPIPI